MNARVCRILACNYYKQKMKLRRFVRVLAQLRGEVFVQVSATEEGLYRHDSSSLTAAMRLAALSFPEHSVPLGIYYPKSRDLFSLPQAVKKTIHDLPELFRAKASWQQS